MIAEILGNMIIVSLMLIVVGFVLFGYYTSYKVYKEYRGSRRRGDHTELFFSIILFTASVMGTLVCLAILADAMGW